MIGGWRDGEKKRGRKGRTYRGMVGGGPEAVEEGVEPGSNEGDLNEGFGFPRVEEKEKAGIRNAKEKHA